MRSLIAGVDAGGRSCIVSVQAVAPPAEKLAVHTLHATGVSPPPARPPGRAELADLGVGPGLLRWMAVHWPPSWSRDMHHTDTIDFTVVVNGSLELLLDDGAHRLGPGDSVVVTGVDHGWRAGPDGCSMVTLVLGTPEP